MRLLWPSPCDRRAWFAVMVQVSLIYFFRFGMDLTDTIFLGKLRSDPHYPDARPASFLASSSIALTWIRITANIFYSGYCSALQSLCSQAYGAGNPAVADMWLVVALIFAFCTAIPVGASWWFTQYVTGAALGSSCDDACKELVALFARISLLWLLPEVFGVLINNYLRAARVVLPSLIIAVVVGCLNVLLNAVFIHGWAVPQSFGFSGFGFAGSPVATSVSRWLQLLFIICAALLVRHLRNKRAAESASSASISVWQLLTQARFRTFASQSLPSALGGFLETLQFQVAAMIAAKLGSLEIATHNAVLQILFFLTSVMYGISSATVVTVGNALGNGDEQRAKAIAVCTLCVATLSSSVAAVVFIVLRDSLGHIFSSDPEVWNLASELGIVLGVCYSLLTLFFTSMAVLQAQARPVPIMVGFLLGSWCVGLPVGWTLGIHFNMGLKGIWYGGAIGYLVTSLITCTSVLRCNWAEVTRQAVERSKPQTRTRNVSRHSVNRGGIQADSFKETAPLLTETDKSDGDRIAVTITYVSQ
eukprot:TRINITY_DN43020_c0_g1_i1.p1 TRINITY_DN43020_c0_g1~~TRINITY_DN43020_c0_g1_i1.p1  ORF type:complete len:541 (+),score=60.52 TRINITY_DN43020_c0_g1_i1:27-1625(+)